MAHTVETLSKLLRKSPDQVITILSAAGIDGKTADSNISAEERQILMSSLSKRSATKSSISVSRKTTKPAQAPQQEALKFKLKRSVKFLKLTQSTEVDDAAAILKAKEALEAGRIAEQKDEEHDAKRNDMVRQQKIKNEELQAQKTLKEQAEKEEKEKREKEKIEADKEKDKKKGPKRLRSAPDSARKEKSFMLQSTILIESLRRKRELKFLKKFKMSRHNMASICQLSQSSMRF